MTLPELVLDHSIRDWVLVPMVLVMFLVGLIRHYMTLAMSSSSSSSSSGSASNPGGLPATGNPDKPADKRALKEHQLLIRSKMLRENGGHIHTGSFRARRHFLNAKERGIFEVMLSERAEAGANSGASVSNMMDPNNMGSMMDNMKRQMGASFGFTIQQLLLMGWVNSFFSGFIVAKFPFPLTARFRGMVQRGIELSSLDVSWVTALSLYFLIMIGLRGVNSLILGDKDQSDSAAAMMQQQQQMMTMGMNGQPDMVRLIKAEKENLDLVNHDFALKDVESRLLLIH